MNTSTNFTAEEQYDYRESQKDFWDLNNVIETAEKKGEKKGFEMGEKTGFAKGEKTGFEKGEKTGFEKGIIESARNMIKAGVDKQTVINALNLTPEIIEEL